MARKTKPPAAAARRRKVGARAKVRKHAPIGRAAHKPAKPKTRAIRVKEIAERADLPEFFMPDADRKPRSPETDSFRPPKKNTRVYCLHCQQKYDSYRIEWREFKDKRGKAEGFWCCPIEGCDGKGFLFDIYPTDPNWEDDEERGISGGWFDDDGNPSPPPFADVPW